MDKPELQIWYNGSDSIVAFSAEDATKIWEEATGEDWAQYEKDGEKWEVRTSPELKIWWPSNEPPNFVPDGATTHNEEFRLCVTASNEAWIIHNGRGWLCSENY